ncbi:CRISPR-associated endoribonuclease Cas6 [Fontibacillus solani]|uniref:CRISPR-associated endoribonuclease Cas6 n=1 Tax=Fontibacillus solani TaxID=1572857 RepID=A0A7W3SP53_9BACL|nr:CRISPR-associated protein Cas6 [Fontibacillus solani]MBA9083573.1 CRISPR-associated endoribonuclease Cas6 [Fontibacillus solani]
MNKYFELKATVLLKQSKHHLEMPEVIGKWIGRAECIDPELKEQHYSMDYKLRCFSQPYPREKDGIYKQNRVYVIAIRSSVENMLRRLSAGLRELRDDESFELLAVTSVQSKRLAHITELTTVNPAIATVDSKPWVPEMDIELLLDRINSNAEKKYNQLYPDAPIRLDYDFVEGIQILNQKPIAYHYKGRKMLGNKFRLMIRSDELSQRLAYIALGAGILEKNSILGAGYCVAKGLD